MGSYGIPSATTGIWQFIDREKLKDQYPCQYGHPSKKNYRDTDSSEFVNVDASRTIGVFNNVHVMDYKSLGLAVVVGVLKVFDSFADEFLSKINAGEDIVLGHQATARSSRDPNTGELIYILDPISWNYIHHSADDYHRMIHEGALGGFPVLNREDYPFNKTL